MANSRISKEEEETERKELEREISDLRTAKTELFEKTRPYNEELQRIAKRERECSDKLNRLSTETHDREAHEQLIQRIFEMESVIKQLKYENENLILENQRSAEINKKLKQSLDQSTNYSKIQKQKIAELQGGSSTADNELKIPLIAASDEAELGPEENGTHSELQEQLNQTTELMGKTKEELIETRQRLSYIQERLTVAEQVTAATQQRALQESDNDPEQLGLLQVLELIPQLQQTKATGFAYIIS